MTRLKLNTVKPVMGSFRHLKVKNKYLLCVCVCDDLHSVAQAASGFVTAYLSSRFQLR